MPAVAPVTANRPRIAGRTRALRLRFRRSISYCAPPILLLGGISTSEGASMLRDIGSTHQMFVDSGSSPEPRSREFSKPIIQ